MKAPSLRMAHLNPLTIVESPYAGDIERNTLYLKRALRHSYEQGELPFASHGFFPSFLNEEDPKERSKGISMGYEMWEFACQIVFYCDYGMSPGMARAWQIAYEKRKRTVVRCIGQNP